MEYCTASNPELLSQSKKLLADYTILPRSVTQDNLVDYCADHPSYVPLGNVANLASVYSDKYDSYTSAMSCHTYTSPYSICNRLAIFHSTGTGKSLKALFSALAHNKDIVIIGLHSEQFQPFLKELAPGRTLSKIYPYFNKQVDFITCKSLVNMYKNGDWPRMDYYLKDRCCIIDELHKIKASNDKDYSYLPLYSTMIEIQRRYSGNVTYMTTATPLVDVVSEIEGLCNLVKNTSSQSSTPEMLAYSLTGYVSRLLKQNLPTHNKVVRCPMSPVGHQWVLYQQHQHDRSSVYSKISAVSRYVTQDGDDAAECDRTTMSRISDRIVASTYNSRQEYYDACISGLWNLSAKYYYAVMYLRQNRGFPKVFYDSWKKRGGTDRWLQILTMPAVGYSIVLTEADAYDMSKPLKVLALYKIKDPKRAVKLLDIYNSEQNKDGELIEILVLTPVHAQSMSVLTARITICFAPQWNETTMNQIRGRANRRGSLWFLPQKDRVAEFHTYLLCKPDGSDTVESKIMEDSANKHSNMQSTMSVLSEISIEKLLHRPQQEYPSYKCITYPHNTRVNYNARVCRVPLSAREIELDVVPYLQEMEKFPSFFSFLENISLKYNGYNKLIHTTIRAIERTYIKMLSGSSLTTNEDDMLAETSKTFFTHDGKIMHLMYFVNQDTVEYQMLASKSDRMLRMLDSIKGIWVDVRDPYLIDLAGTYYLSNVIDFIEKNKEGWSKYGFYMVRYTLPPCYRLVKYRPKSEMLKTRRMNEIDLRKVPRGRKYAYYDKDSLLKLLSKLSNISEVYTEFLHRNDHVKTIFEKVYKGLERNKILLRMPI